MAESIILEDFITENDLIGKFGLKLSILNRARKKHSLPCYHISTQGPRLYLKNEVTDYFLSCRTVAEVKDRPKKKIRRKT